MLRGGEFYGEPLVGEVLALEGEYRRLEDGARGRWALYGLIAGRF